MQTELSHRIVVWRRAAEAACCIVVSLSEWFDPFKPSLAAEPILREGVKVLAWGLRARSPRAICGNRGRPGTLAGRDRRPNPWRRSRAELASGFDRHGDAGNHGRKGFAVDGARELEIELPQVVWGFARIESHVEDDCRLPREAGMAHPGPRRRFDALDCYAPWLAAGGDIEAERLGFSQASACRQIPRGDGSSRSPPPCPVPVSHTPPLAPDSPLPRRAQSPGFRQPPPAEPGRNEWCASLASPDPILRLLRGRRCHWRQSPL